MSENPRELKIQLKKRIVAILNQRKEGIEKEKLFALIELDTGFGEKVIKRTLYNLEVLEIIQQSAGKIYLKKQ